MALIPVGSVLALVLGEGLRSAYAYGSGEGDIPFWTVVAAGGPALVVLALPWVLGRRAVEAGEPSGTLATWIGAVVGVLFVLQNLLAHVLGTVLD